MKDAVQHAIVNALFSYMQFFYVLKCMLDILNQGVCKYDRRKLNKRSNKNFIKINKFSLIILFNRNYNSSASKVNFIHINN